MTAENTPAARTSPREQMLTDAETHQNMIVAQLHAARTERDRLTAELRRITSELQAQILIARAEIRDLVQDQGEAEALVKSLTPRTRKPSRTETADEDEPVIHEPRTAPDAP